MAEGEGQEEFQEGGDGGQEGQGGEKDAEQLGDAEQHGEGDGAFDVREVRRQYIDVNVYHGHEHRQHAHPTPHDHPHTLAPIHLPHHIQAHGHTHHIPYELKLILQKRHSDAVHDPHQRLQQHHPIHCDHYDDCDGGHHNRWDDAGEGQLQGDELSEGHEVQDYVDLAVAQRGGFDGVEVVEQGVPGGYLCVGPAFFLEKHCNGIISNVFAKVTGSSYRSLDATAAMTWCSASPGEDSPGCSRTSRFS